MVQVYPQLLVNILSLYPQLLVYENVWWKLLYNLILTFNTTKFRHGISYEGDEWNQQQTKKYQFQFNNSVNT